MFSGSKLKQLRTQLGITVREVEEQSRHIAQSERSDDFYISNSWLSQIEKEGLAPSFHKLYSLSAIYRVKFTDLLLLYGVDLQRIGKYQLDTRLEKTHLATIEVYDKEKVVDFPIRFDPAFRPERTSLLSRMVEVWGEVPIALIQHLDIRHSAYGYIGLRDYTLSPLLRPGSFVQIDHRERAIRKQPWRTEFDRPIYFLELREEYACGWCELQKRKLLLIPHPLSGCAVRQFDYEDEAEVVGRVTGVAMRLVDYPDDSPGERPRLPKQL